MGTQASEQIAELQGKLAEAVNKAKESEKAVITLQDELARSEANLRRQSDEIDVLRRDNTDLREQVEKLSEPWAKIAEKSDAPAANIRGRVTAVQGDAMSVNIGSAQGVHAGMVLVIHRKDQLVGYLRIEEVDVDQSAGVIEKKQVAPKRGDTVFVKE